MGFVWDKYEATFPDAKPDDVLRFWQVIGDPAESPPCQGYGKAVSFGDQVRVWWDGYNGQFGPHVVVEGGRACNDCVALLRSQWPDHRVSRADVCLDFDDGPGTFERIQLAAHAIARAQRPKVQTNTQGDWLDKERGRTLYIGGKYSTHRARIYEKGKEQREKGLMPEAPINWTRYEVQVRPPREKKAEVAYLEPLDVARSNKWSAQITQALGQSVGHGVLMTRERTLTTDLQSIEYMLNTYSNTLRRAIQSKDISEEMLIAAFKAVLVGKRVNIEDYL